MTIGGIQGYPLDMTNGPTNPVTPKRPQTHPVVAAQNASKAAAVKRPPVLQRILDKQMADARTKVVQTAEDLDTEGQLPAFLGNMAMFRDTIFSALPEVAQKLVRFMLANPYTYTPEKVDVHGNVSYGAAQQLLPDDVALTPEQVRIMHLLLAKATPGQMDVDLLGKQKAPLADNQVHITINQVGHTPDYHDLPGQVVGINRPHPGAAIPTAQIVFNSPGDPTNQPLASASNTMTITVPAQIQEPQNGPEELLHPGDLPVRRDPG